MNCTSSRLHGTTTSMATLPGRRGRRVLALTATAALMVAAAGGAAQAAPGDTSTQSTTANVQVGSAITLTALTAAFTLIGNPGDTVSTTQGGVQAPTVVYRVTTNNVGGYNVTVQPTTATLVATRVGNTASIPIAALTVAEAAGTFAPLDFAAPVQVHTQAGPSAVGGDQLGTDFQIVIPFVVDDTYSAALNYVATAL